MFEQLHYNNIRIASWQTFRGIVASCGGYGYNSIDRAHIDDGTSSTWRRLILLGHLPCSSLPALHMDGVKC